MCPVVRISTETYSRLEKHAVGFDSPSNVIDKILDHYEGANPALGVTASEPEIGLNSPERRKRLYTNKEIQQKIAAVAQHLPFNELESLCHKPKSKEVFDINFPLFVKLPATAIQASKRAAVKTDDEVSRWTWKYEFKRDGYVYAICTQWYPKSDVLVRDWLKQCSK
jgi:hypothetical protein